MKRYLIGPSDKTSAKNGVKMLGFKSLRVLGEEFEVMRPIIWVPFRLQSDLQWAIKSGGENGEILPFEHWIFWNVFGWKDNWNASV